jgi:hypothetical protein
LIDNHFYLLPRLQKQGDLLPDVNITIGGAADQLEKPVMH